MLTIHNLIGLAWVLGIVGVVCLWGYGLAWCVDHEQKERDDA